MCGPKFCAYKISQNVEEMTANAPTALFDKK